jgi:hypothetical protein
MRSTSSDAGDSLVVEEDREALMALVTQLQPGRQFRLVKMKLREAAALRRARVEGRGQMRDGKQKSG